MKTKKRAMHWLMRLSLAAMACAMLFASPHAAQAWTFKVVYDFCSRRDCKDGMYPQSQLLVDQAGNLTGTTTASTPSHAGGGTVFKLVRVTSTKWKAKTLHVFPSQTLLPAAPLVIDVAGNLYGTYHPFGNAHGQAFELSPKRTFKILSDFGQAYPIGGLTYQGAASGAPYDGSSTLYGTTEDGGTGLNCSSGRCGSVFTLVPEGDSWIATTIYNFCTVTNCSDGSRPEGGLIVASSGALFGTTGSGPAKSSFGTVFELVSNSGSWTETNLKVFCREENCNDGHSPLAPVVQDAAGDLYGTTSVGGPNSRGCCGVLFKLSPQTMDYQVLYAFCARGKCKDGANPSYAAPVIGADGALYGTTITGGGNDFDQRNLGGGTVYALNGSALQTLHAFCSEKNCRDGEYPYGGVVMDSAGNLYGTTEFGGRYDRGVVFELTP
jgi:uncharacterized repeat protein (TIGR03803 family)